MSVKNSASTGMSTAAFADSIGAKAGSIRVRLCQTGSYFGIKPKKLPNGRLLWPADSVERLLGEVPA
ncbi:monooxygenase [Salinisphaera japonica YTM-1]|uniref:Monooxygenase n=2 Tax=Salinisphaera TaxID=180541 RepID=A0A423Q120_9GAMM|nr:monooxygenase [Salinisphaera japonica]ROO31958.1 monooxygenase [Salinisphaera japonica YTM-1]